MTGIWAIVLAAGESRRMGSPKMLLPFNGTTVIGQVIENVLAAGKIDTLVITGAERDEIMKEINRYPCAAQL